MTQDIQAVDIVRQNFSSHDLEGPISRVIAILSAALESVPIEYRAVATLVADVGEEYGTGYCNFELRYERPETDMERHIRVHADEQRQRTLEHHERKQLADLQAKYGNGS